MTRPLAAAMMVLIGMTAMPWTGLVHATGGGGAHCSTWFAGPGRCYSEPQRLVAEARPFFPIDPPGPVVSQGTKLGHTQEIVTRFPRTGTVNGIYFIYGHVPEGTSTSRYLIVGETIHTIGRTPYQNAPAGAAPAWEADGVLPLTHVKLSVLGNLPSATERQLALEIEKQAPKRMGLHLPKGFGGPFDNGGQDLWHVWGIHPAISKREATTAARARLSRSLSFAGALLGRVIEPDTGSNDIEWVVMFRGGCGTGPGTAILYVNATTGDIPEESFSCG